MTQYTGNLIVLVTENNTFFDCSSQQSIKRGSVFGVYDRPKEFVGVDLFYFPLLGSDGNLLQVLLDEFSSLAEFVFSQASLLLLQFLPVFQLLPFILFFLGQNLQLFLPPLHHGLDHADSVLFFLVGYLWLGKVLRFLELQKVDLLLQVFDFVFDNRNLVA